jgi:glutathione peroxidase
MTQDFSRWYRTVAAAILAVVPPACQQKRSEPAAQHKPEEKSVQNIYGFEAKDIEGKPVRLETYAGKVLLLVNVASKCGFTPQYAGLEKLYRDHRADGFVILGFPCDQFGNQEPGTESEIKDFCSSAYEVSFPLFSKIEVNGQNAHPLYRYLRIEHKGKLTRDTPGAERLLDHLEKNRPDLLTSDVVHWNFTKFLIDRKGRVVKRFEPVQTPEAIEADVTQLLAAK